MTEEARLLGYREFRIPGEMGRDYIEAHSESDRKHKCNSFGRLARENAYGEIVADYSDGRWLPVICGHGGSMWLCRDCKNKLLAQKEMT